MPLTEEEIEHDMRQAAFNQNHLTFRSLNQQMWQIPLISMTLTGGLWFGVSRVQDYPIFQVALLFLALVGNAALIVVIQRLRFVMDEYLKWLRVSYERGFVSAQGDKWHQRSFVVRTSFQIMLFLTAAISLGLLIVTVRQTDWKEALGSETENSAMAFYESHAKSLADGYEAVSLEAAHPALVSLLDGEFKDKTLSVLDVGAGTGRDAAWLAGKGYRVVAVEPSAAMQEIGKRLHANAKIDWQFDNLPKLDIIRASGETFDLIILSAVWMHLAPEQWRNALESLSSLLKPNGIIYLTLRIGPEEKERGIYAVSAEKVIQLAASLSYEVEMLDEHEDLLGRRNIKWQSIRISVP